MYKDIVDINLRERSERVKTGMMGFDRLLGGVRPGEITLMIGASGSGKSTLAKQVLINVAEQNKKIWLFDAEFPNDMTKQNLMIQLAGAENLEIEHDEYYKMDFTHVKEEKSDIIDKWLSGKIYVHDDSQTYTDDIIESMIAAKYEHNIDVFVLDNLMMFRSQDEDKTKWDEQAETMKKLQEFVIKEGVHVFIVAHAKKPSAPDQRLTQYCVMGSSEISNLSSNIITVERLDKESPQKFFTNMLELRNIEYDSCLKIHKNRVIGLVREAYFTVDPISKSYFDPFIQRKILKRGWETGGEWLFDVK